MKIIDQRVTYDDLVWKGDMNYCHLVTKYDDGSIRSEPITVEEAAKFQAQNGF